ncbi:glucans biosynthesis glucosyltransferase MdoH [Pelagibius sp. CAU 1746]|uniref:glucans biosynthesis glucosyltransferase MdoH n=1 Tax=Pelagibius sp. CAU 1746 TaxID=3140370 RepID=UPI00325AAD09
MSNPADARPRLRRQVLLLLVVASTGAAAFVLGTILAADGFSLLELGILFLFSALFAWITTAFWLSLLGFAVRRLGLAGRQNDRPAAAPARRGSTALVMPIYNEDPDRVVAGLRAILNSLCAQRPEGHFDAYLLSDTTDPDTWLAEELAWSRLNREFADRVSVFYRHRPRNLARKSGNIADFCESWGYRYDYMVVLDADSIMTGACLVELTARMDANPRVGLIQVPPLPVLRESLFARSQQFAGSVYGPPFAAGLAYWLEGDSNYWGHNAIIRVAPFTDHCGLPELPGREPFGGEILSHDFVEAALLRRAGWEVWLADDLDGSFEEPPPTLIDHAKRDRRWCQGNLQHLGVVAARGLRPLSRLHFVMGVMSYLSSLLWLLLLALSGLEAWRQERTEHSYFIDGDLFPNWPVSYAFEATTLLAITLGILYLPKVFGYLTLLGDRRRLAAHGGALKAALGVVLESLMSILLSPILMLFQSGFIVSILAGRSVRWAPQQRDDDETSWREAVAAHSGHTAFALLAGGVSYALVPDFFWWLTPVLAGPLLSIPLSRFTSRADVGRKLRDWGLFLTPCESEPPAVLQRLAEELAEKSAEDPQAKAPEGLSLFEQAIGDPFMNALHRTLLEREPRAKSERLRLDGLIARWQEGGPGCLSRDEKRDLLSDPTSMATLHALAWQGREDQPPGDGTAPHGAVTA